MILNSTVSAEVTKYCSLKKQWPLFYFDCSVVPVEFFLYALKCWKGKFGLFCDFVLVFIQRSVWSSPPFLSWADWDLSFRPSLHKQTLSLLLKMQICYLTGFCFRFGGEGNCELVIHSICSDGKMRWRFDVTSWIMNMCLNMVIKGDPSII